MNRLLVGLLLSTALSTAALADSTCPAHQWLKSFNYPSPTTCAQPAVPDITGVGTGVATALGNATNGTGGLVTYGGAFGNATGHASLDLPLTGGTLSGGLLGTSASMSGNITMGTGINSGISLTSAPNSTPFVNAIGSYGIGINGNTGTINLLTNGGTQAAIDPSISNPVQWLTLGGSGIGTLSGAFTSYLGTAGQGAWGPQQATTSLPIGGVASLTLAGYGGAAHVSNLVGDDYTFGGIVFDSMNLAGACTKGTGTELFTFSPANGNITSTTVTVTITSTVTTGDRESLTFSDAALNSGNGLFHPISFYTNVGGDTTTTIATALKNAINADSTLSGLSIAATSASNVTTISGPVGLIVGATILGTAGAIGGPCLAVNHIMAGGTATGTPPVLQAVGDANTGGVLSPNGTGAWAAKGSFFINDPSSAPFLDFGLNSYTSPSARIGVSGGQTYLDYVSSLSIRVGIGGTTIFDLGATTPGVATLAIPLAMGSNAITGTGADTAGTLAVGTGVTGVASGITLDVWGSGTTSATYAFAARSSIGTGAGGNLFLIDDTGGLYTKSGASVAQGLASKSCATTAATLTITNGLITGTSGC